MAALLTPPCSICGSVTVDAGLKWGRIEMRDFYLRQCPSCGFGFVADPCTDYARIYSAEYYRGEGADPMVDYSFELASPSETIRQYEWRGIFKAVNSLVRLTPKTQWLDFGCGNGGLVRFCRTKNVSAVGFEEGAIVEDATNCGIPILSRNQLIEGSFDVITAIEVLEHVQDPLEALRFVRSLLKPNGLFFLTTGNLEPFRKHLASWSYVVPEIHISFFEPNTLKEAFAKSGFRAEFPGYLPGSTDILRFKILKNLGFDRRRWYEGALPWPILSRLAELRFHLTSHPIGWAGDLST